MDKTAISSKYTYEFEDGSTCQMSLTFVALKKLSSVDRNLYLRQQKVMTKGNETEFDTLTVLYAAYRCANLESADIMTEETFIEKCGSDRFSMNEALQALTNPKKRKASEDLSN